MAPAQGTPEKGEASLPPACDDENVEGPEGNNDDVDPAEQTPDASEPEPKKRKLSAAVSPVDSPTNTNDKPLSWDASHCGDLVVLSNKQHTMETCILDPERWNCVLASQAASSFRVRLDKVGSGGDLWIGYCKKDSFVPNGSTRGRFCQILRAEAGVTGDDTSHPFTDGDEVSITHHRANHTIVFQKNGQDIGIEYEHVTDEARFPAVVTNSDRVTMTLL